MNSGNDKFEREFEAFLNEEDSRLAALYRKLPQQEPDPKLDAAVHSMAHRALNPQLVATPRATAERRRARWVPALGAAAGVVLAAGIAWRIGPSLHSDADYTSKDDVISVRTLDLPAPATEPPLSPAPPPAADRNTAPAAPGVAGKLQGAPVPKPAATAPSPPAVLSAPEQPRESLLTEPAPPPAGPGALSKTENAAKPQPAPQAFPAPAKAQKRAPEMDAVERKQIMAAGAWQNLHERYAPQAERSEEKAKSLDDNKSAESRAAAPASQAGPMAAPAPTPAAPPAPREAPASAANADNERVVPPSAPAALQQAQPPGSPAPARAAKRAAPPPAGDALGGARADEAPQRQRSKDANASLYPEHWLENIRTMLKEGRRDEALQSLAEFRRLYPDYHLPDDLRDLK